ncbi:MAG: hypothetical protein IPG50_15740 [Myxococcales bacterium]|nr:hypothetical protein [Myxococcales bacterium]
MSARNAFVALLAAVSLSLALACSSSSETGGGSDAGATSSDGAKEGSAKLPSCVDLAGYQCQVKGCLGGFIEAIGYDCGNSGGSCCERLAAGLDAATAADARDAATE